MTLLWSVLLLHGIWKRTADKVLRLFGVELSCRKSSSLFTDLRRVPAYRQALITGSPLSTERAQQIAPIPTLYYKRPPPSPSLLELPVSITTIMSGSFGGIEDQSDSLVVVYAQREPTVPQDRLMAIYNRCSLSSREACLLRSSFGGSRATSGGRVQPASSVLSHFTFMGF